MCEVPRRQAVAQAAQEELRRRAVALAGEGHSQVDVAALLDVSRQSVSEAVRAHRPGGESAPAAGKRGRRAGEKTALAPWQQAQIAKAIREKNPDQLRLPRFLWTRALVCELNDRRYSTLHRANQVARRERCQVEAESGGTGGFGPRHTEAGWTPGAYCGMYRIQSCPLWSKRV